MKRTCLHIPTTACSAIASACLLVCASSLHAQEFFEDMRLIDARVGPMSSLADSFSDQSGGLSDGSRYSFNRYYDSDGLDVRFTFLTPMSPNFGVIWGFGTGESGPNFQIEPSLKFGFLATEPIGDNALLSFSLTTVLDGYFRESACVADYGAIGGIQPVNCRMADSVMPPSETLDYLLNAPPSDQFRLSLRYRLEF